MIINNKKLFGTDGIRGKVNNYPMNAEVALKFGMASGIYCMQRDENSLPKNDERRRAVIAKDTRLSGYLIEPAITAGLIAVGVDVTLVGPMPTAAVPMLVKSLRADLGIMITASHNPYYDNGLKLFDQNGFKVGDECEMKIQEIILNITNTDCCDFKPLLAEPEGLGRATRLEDAPGRYIEYVKNSYPKQHKLNGLRIVVDCANGAVYKIAPMILWELGAEVISIGCDPNGININENCGSMHPSLLSQKVLDTRADVGFAFDGDGDRVVVCNELGKIVHGDHVLGLIAKYLHLQSKLSAGGIVLTHMSNGGLIRYLESFGGRVHITQIGDKHVMAEMYRQNSNFGGEQSGHIICGDYTTTGDGIIAALQILAAMGELDMKTSEMFEIFPLTPQVEKGVKFFQKNPLDNQDVAEELEVIKNNNPGIRIIVRKSGTENIIRIMVEGKDARAIKVVLTRIKSLLQKAVAKEC